MTQTFYFHLYGRKILDSDKCWKEKTAVSSRRIFLMVEIFKHEERILQKSKDSEDEVYEILYKTLLKINFVNEETISLGNFIETYRLCVNIDENDTPFIALTLEIEGELWTNDEILKRGLIKKGFDSFFIES